MNADAVDEPWPSSDPELIGLAERLERERPVPAAAFRGELRRRLSSPSQPRRRPPRVHALIVGYAGAGAMLLLAGAAGVAGIGPLAS